MTQTELENILFMPRFEPRSLGQTKNALANFLSLSLFVL